MLRRLSSSGPPCPNRVQTPSALPGHVQESAAATRVRWRDPAVTLYPRGLAVATELLRVQVLYERPQDYRAYLLPVSAVTPPAVRQTRCPVAQRYPICQAGNGQAPGLS